MNIVKITYVPRDGETKEVTLGLVTRFYESYSFKAKDLNVQIDDSVEDGYTTEDSVLAELISAQINTIELISVDDEGVTASVANLTDYTSVRDIRKEYNLNTSAIVINCVFQKVLIEEATTNEATPA